MHVLIAGLIGLLGGVTSGLFGVGGGIVMVPAMLLLLSPPIRDIKQAVGTSLAVIIPTAAVGSLRHHQFQNVHWPTVLILAPMALVGTWGGTWLTTVVTVDLLKRAFGGLLVVVGLWLLVGKELADLIRNGSGRLL
jgi:uncharacterized membrane protein YfcA